MKNLDLNNVSVEVLNFDEMYEHNGGSGAAAPGASPAPAPSPGPAPHKKHHGIEVGIGIAGLIGAAVLVGLVACCTRGNAVRV